MCERLRAKGQRDSSCVALAPEELLDAITKSYCSCCYLETYFAAIVCVPFILKPNVAASFEASVPLDISFSKEMKKTSVTLEEEEGRQESSISVLTL